MTSREFCYWLQGFFEIENENDTKSSAHGLTSTQAKCIQKHLALVFKHEIDPSYGDAAHTAELNKIHEAVAKNEGIEGLEERVKHLEDHPQHVPAPLIRC